MRLPLYPLSLPVTIFFICSNIPLLRFIFIFIFFFSPCQVLHLLLRKNSPSVDTRNLFAPIKKETPTNDESSPKETHTGVKSAPLVVLLTW